MKRFALPVELVGIALIVAGVADLFSAAAAALVAGTALVAFVEVHG